MNTVRFLGLCMQISKKGTNLFRLNCVCKKMPKMKGNVFGLFLKCLGKIFSRLCLGAAKKFKHPLIVTTGLAEQGKFLTEINSFWTMRL